MDMRFEARFWMQVSEVMLADTKLEAAAQNCNNSIHLHVIVSTGV